MAVGLLAEAFGVAYRPTGRKSALPGSSPVILLRMGDDSLAFLNDLEFPLAAEVEPTLGELQRFTPTVEVLVVPDIDSSLDESPAKTAFWNAFKVLGSWWAELPPY